jgi:hypothetical protein
MNSPVILVIDSDPKTCSFLRGHQLTLPEGYRIIAVSTLGEAVVSIELEAVRVVVIGVNRHDSNPAIQNIVDSLATACPAIEKIFYLAEGVVDFEIRRAQSDFYLVHKPFVHALLQKAIALMYEAPLLSSNETEQPQP